MNGAGWQEATQRSAPNPPLDPFAPAELLPFLGIMPVLALELGLDVPVSSYLVAGITPMLHILCCDPRNAVLRCAHDTCHSRQYASQGVSAALENNMW